MPKRAKVELLKPGQFSETLLASLKEHFVVLDRHGVIVPGDETAAMLIAGIESVLSGSRKDLTIEHACPFSTELRWFSMVVVPLKRPEGRAIIPYTDIRRAEKAEEESRRAQDELTHADRGMTVHFSLPAASA